MAFFFFNLTGMIYFLKGNKFIEFNIATNSLTNINQVSIAKWADGCPPDKPTNTNKFYIDERQRNNTRKRIDDGGPWWKESRRKITVLRTKSNPMNEEENMDQQNDTISNDSFKISTNNRIILLNLIIFTLWHKLNSLN